jgi:hypothetical protein
MEVAMTTTTKTILTLESVLKQVAVERKARPRKEKEQAANELARCLAEKGIFAMYGGKKGHGFWLYRVGTEMAKQLLEAFDPEKFWDLADSFEQTPIIKKLSVGTPAFTHGRRPNLLS